MGVGSMQGDTFCTQPIVELPRRDFDFEDPQFNWPKGIYLTQIPTMQDARRVLGPSCDQQRKARSQLYWEQAQLRSRSRLRLGMHDRGEEYIFANGHLHPEDLQGQNVHLPLHIKVISLDHLHIGANEVFDATSSHRHWPGLHFREELYVVMKIGRLSVSPSAVLEVCGNVFVFECGEIRAEAGMTQSKGFCIRIRGTWHPAFSSVRTLPAEDGRKGSDGANGASRTNTVTGSILGPVWSGSALRGDDGGKGGDGSDGTHGQNGGLSMLADIRIGHLRGFPRKAICLTAQAGQGLPGGNGGDGGDGGSGGDAMHYPGAGGAGGRGGNGGHGGNGGLGSNIFVTIPKTAASSLHINSSPSQGGLGGLAGRGGASGLNGQRWGQPDYQTMPTQIPICGQDGTPGRNGRSRPAPPIHILFNSETPNCTSSKK